MSKRLSPPALHNLVRTWRATPAEVAKELLVLSSSKPPFNYQLLTELVGYALKSNLGERQFVEAVIKREKRTQIRNIFLEVVPLICAHFSRLDPKYVLPAEPGMYVISKDIAVPFRPPMMFEQEQQLIIPWYIFWRQNPLTEMQFRLFVTLAYEMIERNPDTDGAILKIYDFSAASKKDDRTLTTIDGRSIKRLSENERNSALEKWVDGFELATRTAQPRPAKMRSRKATDPTERKQLSLLSDD